MKGKSTNVIVDQSLVPNTPFKNIASLTIEKRCLAKFVSNISSTGAV